MSAPIAAGATAIYLAIEDEDGAPITNAAVRLRLVSGAVNVVHTKRRDKYSDGSRLSHAKAYSHEISGQGNLTIQLPAEHLGYLMYLAGMSDDFTAATVEDAARHTLEWDETAAPRPFTLWQRKGLPNGGPVVRQRFDHCYLQQITVEASHDAPTLQATVELASLMPGVQYAPEDEPVDRGTAASPLIYMSGFTAIEDGLNSIGNANQFSLSVNLNGEVYWGSGHYPRHVLYSQADLTLAWASIIDEQSVAYYNRFHYGTETPADGDVPVADTFRASAMISMNDSDGQSVSIYIPSVLYEDVPELESGPEDTKIEAGFAGSVEANETEAPVQVIVAAQDLFGPYDGTPVGP